MESCQHYNIFHYIFLNCLHEVCGECFEEQIKDKDVQDGMIDFHCKDCNRKRDMAILLQRKMAQKEKERNIMLKEENENLKK